MLTCSPERVFEMDHCVVNGHSEGPPVHTAGYDVFFGGLATESRLRYPWEPPFVPTLLPTVGPMDYRLDGRVLKTFEVRCVAWGPNRCQNTYFGHEVVATKEMQWLQRHSEAGSSLPRILARLDTKHQSTKIHGAAAVGVQVDL